MQDTTTLMAEPSSLSQPEKSTQNTTVSLGADIRKPQELSEWPLTDIMFRIQSGTYRSAIDKIREHEDADQAKNLKLNLPYFIMARLKGSRCEDNIVENTGIVLDFDEVAEPEKLAIMLKEEIPYLRYCFLSPRKGLKAVVVFSTPVKSQQQYARIWNQLVWEIEQQTGYKADNTPDRSRACFVSYDPNLIDNPGAELLPVEDYAVGKPTKTAAFTASLK